MAWGRTRRPANFANAPLPADVGLDGGIVNVGSVIAPLFVPLSPATPDEIQREADR